MKNSARYAIGNAILTAIYVAMVASFMYYAPHSIDQTPSVLTPIAMLLLFVVSAGITGSLVLGRPVLWYLDGRKKEAVMLLAETLAALFVITLAVLCTILAAGLYR